LSSLNPCLPDERRLFSFAQNGKNILSRVQLIVGDIMPAPQLPRIDLAEVALKLTGVSLAVASIAFASHMLSDPGHAPRIVGVEHLAIYARPARHNAPQIAAAAPPTGIDYTPVGGIRKMAPGALLAGYEILDAGADWALLRLPEGRIMRAPRGARIVGLGRVLDIERRGGKWAVVTERGLIGAR
jgi:hypothetical protein